MHHRNEDNTPPPDSRAPAQGECGTFYAFKPPAGLTPTALMPRPDPSTPEAAAEAERPPSSKAPASTAEPAPAPAPPRSERPRPAELAAVLTPPPVPEPSSPIEEPVRIAYRRRGVAVILALLLGGLGAHKLYLGKTRAAFLCLLFAFTLVPLLIALADLVQLLTMTDGEFDARYNFSG